MKVYLAGKITGDPEYQKKFQAAKEQMEKEGHIVLNPAELPEGMSAADYMRVCIAMIDTADIIAFLPSWKISGGAKIERDLCRYIGKKIRYL